MFGNNRRAATKAIILARVSDRDQEDGYSLEAQKNRSLSYCERKNLNVLKIFEIVESSTRGDRRRFMEIIQFIKKQREPIALVADKVDRVQRSFKEYPLLDGLIQEDKLELHFNTENCIIHRESISQEKMQWMMGVFVAQGYIDSFRDNVKRSIEQKIRQGEWISMAPIGYLNTRDARNRGNIIIDEIRAPIVRRIFEAYGTGAYTLSEIVEKAKDWGLRNRHYTKAPLKKSQLHRLLTNPFYYGQMLVKGVLYDHSYEPIITQDQFEACQAVLKGWKKKPFQWAGKEFVFRGILTCSITGRTVTADTKKKTYANGKTGEWTYLRCGNPEKPDKIMWVREELVLEQVSNALGKLALPPDLLEDMVTYLKETDKAERDFVKRQMAEYQTEHQQLQQRLEKLLDLLMDGVITREEYEARKKSLRSRQTNIETHITANRKGDESFKEAFISLVSIASDSREKFLGSTIHQKRALLNFMFANLSLNGSKVLYSFRKPIEQFANCTDLSKWSALVDALRTNLEMRAYICNLNFSVLDNT